MRARGNIHVGPCPATDGPGRGPLLRKWAR
jgi:hypothetical protein